jgi:hypothetical protein
VGRGSHGFLTVVQTPPSNEIKNVNPINWHNIQVTSVQGCTHHEVPTTVQVIESYGDNRLTRIRTGTEGKPCAPDCDSPPRTAGDRLRAAGVVSAPDGQGL